METKNIIEKILKLPLPPEELSRAIGVASTLSEIDQEEMYIQLSTRVQDEYIKGDESLNSLESVLRKADKAVNVFEEKEEKKQDLHKAEDNLDNNI
ncbi:MAG: hypothetical protein KAS32_03570 [Candidatus Peribacteraceae bacterium]|nr:hypothetical protein [Candidatus Peribacteraceae bacterium]